jgi:hypothetical protein
LGTNLIVRVTATQNQELASIWLGRSGIKHGRSQFWFIFKMLQADRPELRRGGATVAQLEKYNGIIILVSGNAVSTS